MNKLFNSQKGHTIAKLLVFFALTNLFLFALGSLATTMKIANKSIMNKSNYNSLQLYFKNNYPSSSEDNVTCTSKTLKDNLKLLACEEENLEPYLILKECHDKE